MTNKMPPEKVPSKASENRRATKPIMEKRRRARINQCLSELKTLILDALNKDPSRHSKLEKADILEMTVRHLQNVQRQQMAAAISTDPSVLNKFRAGFSECASEVTRYVGRIDGVDLSMRQRLLSHLSHCVTSLNAATPFPGVVQGHPNMPTGSHQPPGNSGSPSAATPGGGIAFPGMTPPLLTHLQALNVQIPGNPNGNYGINALNFLPSVHAAALAAATGQTSGQSGHDINNNNPNPNRDSTTQGSSASPPPNPGGKFFGGLSLIPSRLSNGDIAFLLPNQANNQHIFNFKSESQSEIDCNNIENRLNHLPWGPPTPTSPMDRISPTLSRKSSCSPSSSVGSAMSPIGSEVSCHSELPQRHYTEMNPSPKPCSSRGPNESQIRHPSVIVQAPSGSVPSPQPQDLGRDDPVWRPW